MFEIDDTPYSGQRRVTSKYHETFAKMRPGQCIKIDTNRVNAVATSLRTWIEKQGRTDVVVHSTAKMADGYGRVWLMPVKPLRMADVKGRKVINFGD